MKKLLVKLKKILQQFPFARPKGVVYSAKNWINHHNYKIDWFTRKNSDWYLNLYNETVVCYSKPNSIYNDINSYFKCNFIKKNLESNLYYFKGAYVFSNYGVVLSRDNKVFAEFCHYFNTKNIQKGKVYQLFKAFKLNIAKIEENTALLATPESENYYHWMMDSLSRLCLLENFMTAIDYFIVPAALHPFHIDSLKFWGIDEKQLIKVKPTDKLYFENLFVPSLPGSEGNSPKWAVEYLRKKFLVHKARLPKTELVYFSREPAKEQHIINEYEVITILKQRGFLIYKMSNYSIEQQVAISGKAKIIVSAHGAALTNILFADNCQVLEIFSPDYIRPDCYFTLANQLGIEYWYLMGESNHKSQKLAWGDIYIDIENLNSTLDRMLNVP